MCAPARCAVFERSLVCVRGRAVQRSPRACVPPPETSEFVGPTPIPCLLRACIGNACAHDDLGEFRPKASRQWTKLPEDLA